MPVFIVTIALAILPFAVQGGNPTVATVLAERLPGIEAEDIRPTPVPGLWEVAVRGQVVYVSEDGRYLVQGPLVDLLSGVNLSHVRESELSKALANRYAAHLDESRMVVFGTAKARYTVTVFTDIDCGYCRKLHAEIDEYTKRGIKVRYLFYPLDGPGSRSWAKADAVWCSPDRNQAMTRAKQGHTVLAVQPCEKTPVAEHVEVGSKMGVRGTPMIMAENGEMLSGYVPADHLLDWLRKRE